LYEEFLIGAGMKQRKLTPVQTQSLLKKVVGFFDIHYNDNGADAFTVVDGKTYRMVYSKDIKFTGVAYKLVN
jgi:hypothetical protein